MFNPVCVTITTLLYILCSNNNIFTDTAMMTPNTKVVQQGIKGNSHSVFSVFIVRITLKMSQKAV